MEREIYPRRMLEYFQDCTFETLLLLRLEKTAMEAKPDSMDIGLRLLARMLARAYLRETVE
ncbi:MAG: hypothetical protein ACE5LA_03625 [Dehalococcoidales bacterium]